MAGPRGVRDVLAILLILSAAAFAVGRTIEQRSETRTPEGARPEHETEASHPEGDQAKKVETGKETVEGKETGETTGKVETEKVETAKETVGTLERGKEPVETGQETAGGEGALLGVHTDDSELTVLAVVLSLLLAVDVALRGSRTLLRFVVLFGLVFTALDLFWELRRQIGESNGVATAAALVAVLHVAVVGAAVVALRREVPAPVPA